LKSWYHAVKIVLHPDAFGVQFRAQRIAQIDIESDKAAVGRL
jgi:hypothetical protein